MCSEPLGLHYTASLEGTRAAPAALGRAGEEGTADEPSSKVSTGFLLGALMAQPSQG